MQILNWALSQLSEYNWNKLGSCQQQKSCWSSDLIPASPFLFYVTLFRSPIIRGRDYTEMVTISLTPAECNGRETVGETKVKNKLRIIPWVGKFNLTERYYFVLLNDYITARLALSQTTFLRGNLKQQQLLQSLELERTGF